MTSSVPYLTKEVIKELNKTIVVLDTETTGFSPYNDRIIEFGAIKLVNGREIERMNVLINPSMKIPIQSTKVHGITDDMVKDKPTEDYYISQIINLFKDASYLVGHNVSFDIRFLEQMFLRNGYTLNCEYIDTLKFARKFYPKAPNHKLTGLAEYLKIDVKDAHRALADVETTIWLLRHLAYQVMKY